MSASPAGGPLRRYFEDLVVGQRFHTGAYAVDVSGIKTFAGEFDPQPFHLDEAAAEQTIFRGLAASGWHTMAITMRLIVTGQLRPVNGVLGVGVEDLRWPKPVRPGDVLSVVSEVVDMRPSISKPEFGVVKVRNVTSNQEGDPVLVFTAILLVQRRAS